MGWRPVRFSEAQLKGQVVSEECTPGATPREVQSATSCRACDSQVYREPWWEASTPTKQKDSDDKNKSHLLDVLEKWVYVRCGNLTYCDEQQQTTVEPTE